MSLPRILAFLSLATLFSGCAATSGWRAPWDPEPEPQVSEYTVHDAAYDPHADVYPADPAPVVAEAPKPEPVVAPTPTPVAQPVKPVSQPKPVVAPVQDETPAAPVTEEYTVAKGDTLQKISQRFFGTTKRWPDIFALNKDRMKTPDMITVGQKLRIPTK